MKRGQITLFVLIGLLLLLLSSLFFILNFDVKDNIKLYPSDKEAITAFTKSCFETSSKKAIEDFGIKGGYLFDDSYESLNVVGEKVSFYAYQGENVMPSLEYFEKVQLDQFVRYSTLNCIDSYKVFEKKGYEISITEMNITSDLSYGKFSSNLNLNLDVKLADIRENIETNFNYEIETNIFKLLTQAREVVNYFLSNENIDFSFFDDYDIEISSYSVNDYLHYEEYGDNNFIVTLSDNDYVLGFALNLK
tara:strand:- start:1088 stop:1834 length:747 start_codon:yes stop_codon:yes gene_type:complete